MDQWTNGMGLKMGYGFTWDLYWDYWGIQWDYWIYIGIIIGDTIGKIYQLWIYIDIIGGYQGGFTWIYTHRIWIFHRIFDGILGNTMGPIVDKTGIHYGFIMGFHRKTIYKQDRLMKPA